MNKKIKLVSISALLLLLIFGIPVHSYASIGDQGVDWSRYNGYECKFGTSYDKFSISQVGGTYGGIFVDQPTYSTQVLSSILQGKKAHSYIWYQVGNSKVQARAVLDRYLPKILTPSNSIVALDYECGASRDKKSNTEAIIYGMERIKNAGYTPMLYSSLNYIIENIDYLTLIKKFPNCLWVSSYPDYNITTKPNYHLLHNMKGVGVFQFTSTYVKGGLDGNVDLTGITDNGYRNKKQNDYLIGETVAIKSCAQNYSTGERIPLWVKAREYKILQKSGNRVLLANIMSWMSINDIQL